MYTSNLFNLNYKVVYVWPIPNDCLLSALVLYLSKCFYNWLIKMTVLLLYCLYELYNRCLFYLTRTSRLGIFLKHAIFGIWLIWVFGNVNFSEFADVEFLAILIKVNSAEVIPLSFSVLHSIHVHVNNRADNKLVTVRGAIQ